MYICIKVLFSCFFCINVLIFLEQFECTYSLYMYIYIQTNKHMSGIKVLQKTFKNFIDTYVKTEDVLFFSLLLETKRCFIYTLYVHNCRVSTQGLGAWGFESMTWSSQRIRSNAFLLVTRLQGVKLATKTTKTPYSISKKLRQTQRTTSFSCVWL